MELKSMADEKEIFDRLTLVETETASIKNTIQQHGVVLSNHGSKLDAIMQAVTRAESVPKVDWHRIILTVSAIAAVSSIVMGGLIYLIITITSKDYQINRVLIEKNYEINQIHRYYLGKEIDAMGTKQGRLYFNRRS